MYLELQAPWVLSMTLTYKVILQNPMTQSLHQPISQSVYLETTETMRM